MPQGEQPRSAGIALAPGLWKAPRWGGIETYPAALLFSMELIPFIFRAWGLILPITAIVGFWWYVLSQLFERDERYLAIFIKTRWFHNLAYLRGNSLVSTPFERITRVY